MRSYLPVLAASVVLGFAATAYAADTPASGVVPAAISYSSNDGIECHHLVHQGDLTSITECRDRAGWERQRHMMTQKAIFDLQLRGEIQRR